jgi:tripartite-type tricarboxylate transporter receptor subunit TctC
MLKQMRWFISATSGAFLALVALTIAAYSQYPDKPVTIIVPFEAGGANDIMARFAAPALSKELGQPVIVENKPGAGGVVGADIVAKGPADGYRILFTAGGATQSPALSRTFPYDPVNDLVPVSVLGFGPHVFLVNPKLPFKNLKELIDYAKQNPGKLNAAAGGGTTRLESEMFRLRNDIKIEIIPYNGTGRASTSVLAGETDFVIMDTSPVVSLIDSGQLRALAIIGDQRLPALPNIPTAKEQGFSDFLGGITFGAYVQGGTPKDIQQKLNTALNRAVMTPEVKAWFYKNGAKPINMTLEQARSWYLTELNAWKDVVEKAHIELN